MPVGVSVPVPVGVSDPVAELAGVEASEVAASVGVSAGVLEAAGSVAAGVPDASGISEPPGMSEVAAGMSGLAMAPPAPASSWARPRAKRAATERTWVKRIVIDVLLP